MLAAIVFIGQPALSSPQAAPLYRDPRAPLEARVDDLFRRLTEHEKLSLLTGTDFTSQPIPRLGLPGLAFADAGEGVRGGMSSTQGPATAFPGGSVMASTWDRTLLRRIGEAIGDEAKNKGTGVDIQLAPMINIQRSPLGGRDSELFSEDPYLTAELTVPYIEGLQSNGIGACVKVMACNNEETDRYSVNAHVGERALREIYLPAFQAAVTTAHACALMSAYNMVNGEYCSANWYLLNHILRGEWGYDGLVMSDWGGVHDVAGPVNATNDLEMPGPHLLTADNLKRALADGSVTQAAIDHNVRDILRAMIRCGLADPQRPKRDPAEVGSPTHQQIAFQAALEGIVLLKNQAHMLPLDPHTPLKIAVFGPRDHAWQTTTYGSGHVEGTVTVGPLDALRQRLVGSAATVTDAASGATDQDADLSKAGSSPYADLSKAGPDPFAPAVLAARAANVVLIFVGTDNESEGSDRPYMHLPGNQDAEIAAIAAVNPHTVVITNNGGPVEMPWIGHVAAIVQAGIPGEMGGKALAALLFGDTNPSAKLADTCGVHREDYPDYPNFPGKNNQVHYAEGIYVGYRAFDKRHIRPLFPFGYGLSYTTFRYSNLTLSASRWNGRGRITVSAKVTNTGSRSGDEIAQLYVEPKAPRIDRPVRELKGFCRLELAPGQTKTATFTLNPRSFAYCDVPGKQWRADPGLYSIEVAASSRDIRLSKTLPLTHDWTEAIPGLGAVDPYQPKPSLATGKPATASSVIYGNLASYAVDGDPSTRWSSVFSDPQWLAVDLGKRMTISRVTLVWETANASAYQIQVSSDSIHWRTVYSTTSGAGGTEHIRFAPTQARWVRMYGTKRATQWGYSLYSFDVY